MQERLARSVAPEERVLYFIWVELRNAQSAFTHAKLAFGFGQIIIVLLASYSLIRCVSALIQIIESQSRYFAEVEVAFTVLALLPVFVGAVWLVLILKRLYRAFVISIRKELADKVSILVNELPVFEGLRQAKVFKELERLLHQMGMHDFTWGRG